MAWGDEATEAGGERRPLAVREGGKNPPPEWAIVYIELHINRLPCYPKHDIDPEERRIAMVLHTPYMCRTCYSYLL